MIYVVSDLHFFHDNIIKFVDSRKIFKKTEDFEKFYVDIHNQIVKDDNLVIFLGDMMHGRKSSKRKLKSIMGKLKGKKWLIKGNHDTLKDSDYYECHFELVRDYLIIGDKLLVHYPLTENSWTTPFEKQIMNLKKSVKTIYHGHIHNRTPESNDGIQRINCCIDYKPNNFDLIPLNIDIFY